MVDVSSTQSQTWTDLQARKQVKVLASNRAYAWKSKQVSKYVIDKWAREVTERVRE